MRDGRVCPTRCGMHAAAVATDHRRTTTAAARHDSTQSVDSQRSLRAGRTGRAVTPPAHAVSVAPSTRTKT